MGYNPKPGHRRWNDAGDDDDDGVDLDAALDDFEDSQPDPIDLLTDIVDAALVSGERQSAAAIAAAEEQARAVRELIGGDYPHALTESAMEDAETINDFMRDAIRTDVDELMGAGWLDSLMSQVSGANANVVDVVDQMLPSMTEFVGAKLRGEVSPEQARQFDMRMGEDVLRLYGRTDADDPQSRGYEVAQWMGQIEQNQLMGMQLAPGVAQFAGLPIQSAADVTNVTNPYRTDLANVSAMSSNLLGLAVQQGTVSPNTTLQVANQAMAQNLGTASQIAMANQQATMASATSMLNFQADRYAADMALQGALAGASATRSGGLLSGLGGLAGGIIASSDRRLKQDIVPVGSLPNGLTVYKFRYKWGGPVHTGLMADEVRQVHPEAVIRVGGYDAVDYGKAVL